MRSLALVLGIVLAGVVHAGDPIKGRTISEKGVGGPPCASCHGLDGAKPVAPENPILAGQHYDYLVRALTDYKIGKRSNAIMKGFAAPLSKKDIEDVAAWFASQKSNLHDQR